MNTPSNNPKSKLSELQSSIKDYIENSLGHHATMASMALAEAAIVGAAVFAIIKGCSN